jgi:alpha-tubulin suppressor-like RCC1 family protein
MKHTDWIKSDGTLWAWGWNMSGGLGAVPPSIGMLRFGSENKWTTVSTGVKKSKKKSKKQNKKKNKKKSK